MSIVLITPMNYNCWMEKGKFPNLGAWRNKNWLLRLECPPELSIILSNKYLYTEDQNINNVVKIVQSIEVKAEIESPIEE